ncbi:U32 family peptidase [Rhodocyclus tenuis]|uniref:U32 family peptidase n=2 Tax=Rhodocyclus gracilis TaxID=2929842 RepID=A0ABX0WGG5_9RHOO|nr:U32 family peptidase [Rhodocyclus gracilis]
MSRMPHRLELLAPARNADFGIEAIRHGADAVYIGAPAFGARAAAAASLEDIARLANYARRFNARTLVALNTLLFDDELETARRLIWQLYEAGADALIVQDMGLLELDLPPIALHASTQTDIRTPEKARFLCELGFSQMVLARELTLTEIRAIADAVDCRPDAPPTLEFFVHGALCVSYSGQCYLSQALGGRSANRGECAQPCRLPWTLSDSQGRIIARDRHLLSLRDNDQSANLRPLVDAGIRSFKIEGRLKDLDYVKNVTAHYRRAIDALLDDMPALCRASSGESTPNFTPQPEKTFNRGRTDYFVNGRQAEITAFDATGFAGEPIGTVEQIRRDAFDIRLDASPTAAASALANGDGLAFFGSDGKIAGLRVNRTQAVGAHWRVWPAQGDAALVRQLSRGQTVFRNRDQAFIRLLEKPSAERHIPLAIHLAERRTDEGAEGYALSLRDERGSSVCVFLALDWQSAHDGEQADAALRQGLARLGNTDYVARTITLDTSAPRFIPASALNALRRQAISELDAARAAAAQADRQANVRRPESNPPPRWPDATLDYRANVTNAAARRFWQHHGVTEIAPPLERDPRAGKAAPPATHDGRPPALMTMRHCLRFSFGGCPRLGKSSPETPAPDGATTLLDRRPTPLTLSRGRQRFTLRFDCRRCEMEVIPMEVTPELAPELTQEITPEVARKLSPEARPAAAPPPSRRNPSAANGNKTLTVVLKNMHVKKDTGAAAKATAKPSPPADRGQPSHPHHAMRRKRPRA